MALVLFSSGVKAQEVKDQVMNTIHFDSVAIQEQGIHSVHVFTEMISENYTKTGNYVLTQKKMEAEFNDRGQTVYKRVNSTQERSYVLGENGTSHYAYTYDDQGRVTKECYAKRYLDYCQEIAYDSEGHPVSITSTGSIQPNDTRYFEWKDGKMVHTYASEDKVDRDLTQKFDEKGRLVYFAYGGDIETKIDYSEQSGLVTRKSVSYRADTVSSIYTYIYYLGNTDKIVYYSEIEGARDTTEVVTVKYDEFDNVMEVRISNFNSARFMRDIEEMEQLDDDGRLQKKKLPIKPDVTVFHFENNYQNGLLARRHITATNMNGKKDKEIDLIEHCLYEKEPLSMHSWVEKEEERYYEWDNTDEMIIEEEISVPPVSKEEKK